MDDPILVFLCFGDTFIYFIHLVTSVFCIKLFSASEIIFRMMNIFHTDRMFSFIFCILRDRHEETHPRITRKSSLWSPKPVQVADAILAISKLKNTKSTGHDLINLQHIKVSRMVTIPYITLIINTSIVTKVFPKPCQHSIIIPIHKAGDIEEPTNFRPINLLSILSKILEKVISTELTEYLENNNFIK